MEDRALERREQEERRAAGDQIVQSLVDQSENLDSE